MADWDKIRTSVRLQLQEAPPIYSVSGLDQAAERLERTVQKALREKIPPPKPFPYAKRWWSYELTQLRHEYNYRRNQWTAATRRGDLDPAIRQAAHKAKTKYISELKAIRSSTGNTFLMISRTYGKLWHTLTIQLGRQPCPHYRRTANALKRTMRRPRYCYKPSFPLSLNHNYRG